MATLMMWEALSSYQHPLEPTLTIAATSSPVIAIPCHFAEESLRKDNQESTHNSAARDVHKRAIKASQGSNWISCSSHQYEKTEKLFAKSQKDDEEEEEEEEEEGDGDGDDDNEGGRQEQGGGVGNDDDEGGRQEEEEEQLSVEMSTNLSLLQEDFDSVEQETHSPQLLLDDLACIVHKCTKEKNCAHALHLHVHMCSQGLESHRLLGNSLVLMLVKAGRLYDAQQVFDKLAYRNDCSWNAIINAYIQQGDARRALALYQATKHEDSVHIRGYTFTPLLKACAQLKDLELGHAIHADISGKKELTGDVFIGSALVHMYAKFGSLIKAQALFDQFLICDTVTWNALIAGYAEHGQGEEGLNCYKRMQANGLSADSITFICSLKACSSIADIEKGQELHADMVKAGLEGEGFAGNTLVDMYVKCGSLTDARNVFSRLHIRNTVSWNVLMAGYAEHYSGEEALICFDKMMQEGVLPNVVTFVCSLKACGSIGATDKGQEIHDMVSRNGLEGDLFVGNTLINMYAKFGMLAKAEDVFDKLRVRDKVSWNALISGYMEHGCAQDALKCFEQMLVEGVEPNNITVVCGLNACASAGAVYKGLDLHAEISRKGLDGDLIISNALVDMYAKFGLLDKAQEVFNTLPLRDTVSWSAIITGYAEHGCGEQALQCFEQTQLEGICPDVVTFACSLKACSTIGARDKGQELHGMIVKQGLEADPFVANTLVDMYAKFGLLVHAQKVFDDLPVRDTITWNALLAGYAEYGHGEEALNCFEQMQLENICPDHVSFACSIKACGSIGATDTGQEIHAMIERKGLDVDLVIGSTLVDMYAKGGLLSKAQEVFDKLSVRDKVLWNAIIAGYVEAERGEDAFMCFERMLQEGISPDIVTFTCISQACSIIGAVQKSQKVLCMIEGEGIEVNPMVGSTLIDMYARCGLLANAHEVFDKLLIQDTVSWNVLIAGYTQLGKSGNVFQLFEKMSKKGKPDQITFLNVLNVCNHAGLVHRGQVYFEAMSKTHGLKPNLEHHTCMVDLFARAGQLEKAEAMIRMMPCHSDVIVWHTILGACRSWGNAELGRHAFERAMRSGEIDAASYICLQNMY